MVLKTKYLIKVDKFKRGTHQCVTRLVSRLVDAAHVQDWEAVVAEGPTLHVRRSSVHDTARKEKERCR